MAAFDNGSPSSKFKIVFLGEQAVGKTAIVTRFIYDNFDETYQATIGLDFLSKTMCLEQNRPVRLQIWDTAGQERFRSLIPSYIRGCSAAVIVYDVTDLDSFKQVDSWINDVKNERGQMIPMFLVGTKIDMPTERQVNTEEGRAKATEHGILFIETSSKTPSHIRELFYKIAQAMPITPGDEMNTGSQTFLNGDNSSADSQRRHIRRALCQDPFCGMGRHFSWLSIWFQ